MTMTPSKPNHHVPPAAVPVPSGDVGRSRRTFLNAGAGLAATTILTPHPGLSGQLHADEVPVVHPGGDDEIRLALVGSGGRGAGAAADALSVTGSNLKLVAMADIFQSQIDSKRRSLGGQFKEKVDVTDDRCFIGMQAYRQAIDALRPGDIVILTTPPAFRAAHFAYAIEKGLHVFMEKPISIDGPSTRRIIELAARANERHVKVAVGLMCRHSVARQELFDRLRNGEAGDLLAFRGYREHPAAQPMDLAPGPPEDMSEAFWQAKRFHGFLWASGGIFSDYYVHQIDEACWMKDAWPVKAEAIGGRHFQAKLPDQNFDNYAVEYTFADGAKFFYYGRHMKGCETRFGLHGIGSKGAFTISARGHAPAKSAIYKGQALEKDAVLWTATQPEENPYRREWQDFVSAIRADIPYNEAPRGAEASLVTAMGRFAAHTGRGVTFEEMLACPDDLTAGVADLLDDSPAPVLRNDTGRYPVPMPGMFKYEYRDA
jgi:predicted dehydrogenase